MAVDTLKHYSNPRVIREIVDYCRGRWVALESESKGRRLFIRYFGRNGPPIKMCSEAEFRELLWRYRNLNIRTIYGSVNIYKSLGNRDSIKDPDNILYSSPVWDVDGSLNHIAEVLNIAREIIYELEKHGVEKSVYLVWSGRGIHIHINEQAFSTTVLKKHHPLDLAYATVEYIILRVYPKIREILEKFGNIERPLKVENKIDIQRVFTAPLSLHRIHDIVCVALKPDELDDFDISWTDPNDFRHNEDWREGVEGEADELGLKAIKEVGTYFARHRARPTEKIERILRKSIETPIIRGRIGRFQVMALLQAARYYLLYGDIDKAKSFGLNRAIFYAWAKYYRPIYRRSRRSTQRIHEDSEKAGTYIDIGGEKAFLSREGWFIIGEQAQKPEDFDREVARKIEEIVPFKTAWEATLDYVKRFPIDIIKSQRRFYEEIYKPVRDEFIKVIQEYITLRRMGEDKRI